MQREICCTDVFLSAQMFPVLHRHVSVLRRFFDVYCVHVFIFLQIEFTEINVVLYDGGILVEAPLLVAASSWFFNVYTV